MDINILHLIKGAKKARGLTVVIDVFRAFSVACYLFNNGAEKIIAVGDLEIAQKLKENSPNNIFIGERGGKKLPGFDYGNSPSEIESEDFTGKILVHTTSAGTQGIVNTINSDKIITGSFVNAQAIIDFIRRENPSHLSLVCMGVAGKKKSEEDVFCARYIKTMLTGEKFNFQKIVKKLKKGSGKRFFDENLKWSPKRDFELCLDLNRFDFVIEARPYKDQMAILSKQDK